MAAHVVTLQYRKEDGLGGTVPITGATVKCQVVRLADGYEFDDGGAFLASGADYPAMSEVTDGVYTLALDITGWTDGMYHIYAEATKSGESPAGQTESLSISSGTVVGSSPADPVTTGLCRVYLYLADRPSSCPPFSALYRSAPVTANVAYALSASVVYSPGTGLLYVDLIRGATATLSCIGRGIHGTFLVPGTPTAAFPTLEMVR